MIKVEYRKPLPPPVTAVRITGFADINLDSLSQDTSGIAFHRDCDNPNIIKLSSYEDERDGTFRFVEWILLADLEAAVKAFKGEKE